AVGHSFGGASLMLAAGGVMRDAGRIAPRRLVVIGAPTRIEWLFEAFARQLGLSGPVSDAMIRHAEEVAGATLADFDTVAVAAGLGTPLLVVHAEDDKEVDADHARRYGAVASARIHWANGFGHRRIISAPEVIDTIHNFLKEDPAQHDRNSAA
ncbi:MAG: alpha/beta fold hydrolase, partial [Pseudorhizobium sp.]